MIYPHGAISLRSLQTYVESPLYAVWEELNEPEPEGWDWRTQGFFHGTRKPIRSNDDLAGAIARTIRGESEICYDLTEEYFKHHPHTGEVQVKATPETFFWEFPSIHGTSYSITKASYLGPEPSDHPSWHLNAYPDGFEQPGYAIASWGYDAGECCYEFRSIGSRLFEIHEDDVSYIWNGIKAADSWLQATCHES